MTDRELLSALLSDSSKETKESLKNLSDEECKEMKKQLGRLLETVLSGSVNKACHVCGSAATKVCKSCGRSICDKCSKSVHSTDDDFSLCKECHEKIVFRDRDYVPRHTVKDPVFHISADDLEKAVESSTSIGLWMDESGKFFVFVSHDFVIFAHKFEGTRFSCSFESGVDISVLKEAVQEARKKLDVPELDILIF